MTGMIFNSLLSYYLNSYWSGKLINYTMTEQLKDIAPSFLLASSMAVVVFLLGLFISASSLVLLITQLSAGTLFVFVVCEVTAMPDYLYLKQIISEKIIKRK